MREKNIQIPTSNLQRDSKLPKSKQVIIWAAPVLWRFRPPIDPSPALQFALPSLRSRWSGDFLFRLANDPDFAHARAVHLFDTELKRSDGHGIARLGEAAKLLGQPAAGGSDSFFSQGFAQQLGKFVQGQYSRCFPGRIVDSA